MGFSYDIGSISERVYLEKSLCNQSRPPRATSVGRMSEVRDGEV